MVPSLYRLHICTIYNHVLECHFLCISWNNYKKGNNPACACIPVLSDQLLITHCDCCAMFGVENNSGKCLVLTKFLDYIMSMKA